MSKHTPGPWIAIFPEARCFHEGSDITSFDVMTEKTRAQFRAEGRDHYERRHEDVANVGIVSCQFWRDLKDEEAKANARLIAAAPALLEAAQMGHIDSQGLPAGDLLAAANVLRNHSLDELAERLERKHAAEQFAIAKATGEQQ